MPELARDRAATFENLYRTTRADLLRYLVRRCRDAEEAADLLSETYVTAWRKLDAIPDEAAQLWLYGVARNLVLQNLRRRRVADALAQRLADAMRTAQGTLPEPDPRSHPLQLALAELSERDREILTLNAWEGLTPRQIAVVMGTSANVVRIRLHRARTRVQEQLRLAADAPPCPAYQPELMSEARP